MSTKITPNNCNSMEVLNEYSEPVNTSEKSAAWHVIYNFCLQNGMPKSISGSGLERVISFIDSLANNQKPSQQTNNQ